MKKIRIITILFSVLVFMGCESSGMNNPPDYNETMDSNSTDDNISDENITIPEDEIKEEELNITTTNLRCYGIYDEKEYGFIDSRDLFISSSTDIILGGDWKDSDFEDTLTNYFTIKSINDEEVEYSDVNNLLLEYCKENINNNKYSNIRYVTSNSNDKYDYSIFNTEESQDITTNSNNILDYTKILRYAYAIDYLYNIDENRTYNNIQEEILLVDGNISEIYQTENNISDKYLYAVAIEVPEINDLDKEIIIVYRSRDDFDNSLSNEELENGYDFYKKVTDKYPSCVISDTKGCYNIVLTGDNMGALIAIDISHRSGELARVFYGLGDDLLISYKTEFDTYLRYNSSINFYTEEYERVDNTGTHFENIVKFSSLENEYNNSINGLIEEKLEPIYNGEDEEVTHIYISPDATIGAGLNKIVNIQEEVD